MELDFSKTTTAAAPAATVVPDTKDEIAVVEQYDIVADREKMNSELVNSDEVDRIVSTIEVNNLEQSSHLERRLQKKFRKHRMSC